MTPPCRGPQGVGRGMAFDTTVRGWRDGPHSNGRATRIRLSFQEFLMTRWFLLGCVLGALCCLGGCSTSEDKLVPVSGTVTLDGKPLDDGSVSLIGEGGSGAETLPVKNGKFEGQAKPGKKRV